MLTYICTQEIPKYTVIERKNVEIKHLLIINWAKLKRTAMIIQAIRGLRNAYPELKITVLTQETHLPLYRKIENLEFVFCKPNGKQKSLFGLIKLKHTINKLKVDCIVDLQSTWRSRFLRFSWNPGEKGANGAIDRDRRRKKVMTQKFRKVLAQQPSIMENCRDIFASLGFPFKMIPRKKQHYEAKIPARITKLAGQKKGKWIGVMLLSKHKGKSYPVDLADKLTSLLSEKFERVFVFGENKYEQQFSKGMELRHRDTISVVDILTFEEKINFITTLDLLISIDSSLLQVASLTNTPTLSIWGATHPHIDSYSYGRKEENIIQLDMSCRPCSVNGKAGCFLENYSCLTDISPESIVARAEELVSSK